MNSSLTSLQQQNQTEIGSRFEVSSVKPGKRGMDLAISGLPVRVCSLKCSSFESILQIERYMMSSGTCD